MEKKVIIMESIIIILIIICISLIVIKPFIINKYNEVKENDIEKVEEEEKIDSALQEGNIILGVNIVYNGEGISVVNNDTVMIASGGNYKISGTLYEGRIVINSDEPVTLNMQNVNINNEEKAVIEIMNNIDVTINLEGDNILRSESNSVIKSLGNITFTGEGNTLISNALKAGIEAVKVIFNKGNYNFMVNDSWLNDNVDCIIKDATINALGNTFRGRYNATISNIVNINIPITIESDDTISLVDMDNNVITTLTASNSSKIFTYSSPNLELKSYKLVKNIASTNETIILNDLDYFTLEEKVSNF